MKPNEPLRGPKYRSRVFQEYLLQQAPERAAEILAGEQTFNKLREDPGSVAAVAERDFLVDMTTPAEWVDIGAAG
jgi:hypothetical protein